jgi:hypothetical protein
LMMMNDRSLPLGAATGAALATPPTAGWALAGGATALAGAAAAGAAAVGAAAAIIVRSDTLRYIRRILTSSSGHLYRNTPTERSSACGVLASDHADTSLSSDCSCASHASWDLSSKREILHLSVPVASTVVALEVLADCDWLPVCASSCGVDHALVRTSTVGVDLVNSHHDLTTGCDLRKNAAVELHDLSSAGLDGVVTSTKSLTASGCGIATEASRVLLEGVAVGAITRSGWVDTNGRSLTTGIASSSNDGAVASHERRRSQKAESNNGRLGEVHTEPVR